ncbi:UNVERIFIED_CONTAM: hypothetical protein HDU68_001176 [Siphonaria sp. JEL0065]|nr:hypothetical protein HDU68_001176 [Siphonaria sp. JEL0065]
MASSDSGFVARVHLSQSALNVQFLCCSALTQEEALLLAGSNPVKNEDLAIWQLKLEPQADDIVIEQSTYTTAAKAMALNSQKASNASKKSLYGGGTGTGLNTQNAGAFGVGLDEFGITAEMLEVNPMEDQTWNDLSLDMFMRK